jgi:hypothetical protein
MRVTMITRIEIINRLLDLMNEGKELNEEQSKLLKDLSNDTSSTTLT